MVMSGLDKEFPMKMCTQKITPEMNNVKQNLFEPFNSIMKSFKNS